VWPIILFCLLTLKGKEVFEEQSKHHVALKLKPPLEKDEETSAS